MFATSLRWRLQLWLAFLLVCVLTGFGVAVFQLQRVNQLRQVDEQLSLRIAALANSPPGRPPGDPPWGGKPPFDKGGPGFDFGPGPDENHRRMPPPPDWRSGPGTNSPRNGPWEPMREFEKGGPRWFGPRDFRLGTEASKLFLDTSPESFYYVVWSHDGTELRRATNAPTTLALPARSRDNLTRLTTRGAFREAVHFTEHGDCLLAGISIAADMAALDRLVWLLVAAGGIVLLLGLGGGWWITSGAIRPIEEISAAANRISAGNLSERIRGAESNNELGRLAAVLNSTFARLEAAFAQQQQFTADASHELRTPLAVLIAETQSTLARERSASEYRETVEICLETGQQMRRLADSLLELARLDAGQAALDASPVDIADLAADAAEKIQPLATAHGIAIHTNLQSAPATGDPQRLAQVLTNLLANAIYYNKPNGEARLTTSVENDAAILTVEDNGVGIADHDLPRIFERFYRVDKSRARSEGRNGLGLAITRAILDAHGATVRVTSSPGLGTTFSIRFPKPQNPASHPTPSETPPRA